MEFFTFGARAIIELKIIIVIVAKFFTLGRAHGITLKKSGQFAFQPWSSPDIAFDYYYTGAGENLGNPLCKESKGILPGARSAPAKI